jgi:hypothetical protein
MPRAMVLADPVACTQRKSINSQYAEVGTSASPTQDKERIARQVKIMGLRPQRSDNVPHIIGAILYHGKRIVRGNQINCDPRYGIQVPCMIMNTVTVRLISSMLLWKSLAMAGIAGRYMFAVKGLFESKVDSISQAEHTIHLQSSHSPKKRRKGCKADNPPFISISEDTVWFPSDNATLAVSIGRLGGWRRTWR